jgi:cytochrome c peroxidase
MGKKQTKKKHYHLLIGITAIIFAVGTLFGYAAALPTVPEPAGLALLGKYVFWDKISEPERMACVTCHNPKVGWTFANSETNATQVAVTGANAHTQGNLKPPTNAYATFIPPFSDCAVVPSLFCGGVFWNGRAEGRDETLGALFPAGATKHIGTEVFWNSDGSPLPLTPATVAEYSQYFGPVSDQALNPMPNPVEQNIDRLAVCEQVASEAYAKLYMQVWGVPIDCSDDTPVAVHAADVAVEYSFDISFKRLMLAVGAYQASEEVNSFTSKRDIALAADSDGAFPLDGFTDQENWGHDLFYGVTSVRNPEGKNAFCAVCHQSGDPALVGTDPEERYTDSSYHLPGFPHNPYPGLEDSDVGLAGHTGIENPFPPGPNHLGAVKTPTLRNVGKKIEDETFIKAYSHNGWFKSLPSIVHFYNTGFLGGTVIIPIPPAFPTITIPYETTTAFTFGITRCPEGIDTEEEALANNCWPAPAVSGTGLDAQPFIVGNLRLTADEEAAIVAYLLTLSDTFTPKAPKPYK